MSTAQKDFKEQWIPAATGEQDGEADRYCATAAHDIRLLVRESRTANAFDAEKFRRRMRSMMGLVEVSTGKGKFKTVFDPSKKKIGYEELPLREVSNELLGADFVSALGNERTGSLAAKKLSGMLSLRESVDPTSASSQQDVNAYSIYVGGLVELKFHEGYDQPDHIGTALVPTEPTQVRQQRIIGEASMNLPDGPTGEKEEYPNQTVVPRWVNRPPVIKYGQKAGLTREAVSFGLGGILLKEIEAGGKALGYLREYLTAATVQGVDIPVGTPGFMAGYTVNTFQYSIEPSTVYNATFQTSASGLYNYVNKFTGSTGLQTWLQLQTARGKLALMREPETNFPIKTVLEDAIVAPGLEDSARNALHATQVFPVYGASGLQSSSAGGGTLAPNPSGNAAIRLWSSAIWNKQLVDSGVSQSNADLYYYLGSVKRAVKWFAVWDTRIIQANALSSDLVERDIVGEWVYSWFGVPAVMDPHYLLEWTN